MENKRAVENQRLYIISERTRIIFIGPCESEALVECYVYSRSLSLTLIQSITNQNLAKIQAKIQVEEKELSISYQTSGLD